MRADHCPGALAIEVESANVEDAAGMVELLAVVGVDGAGQSVFGVIRDGQSFVVVFCFDYGEYRPEDFFLSNASVGRYIGEDSRLNVIAAFGSLDGTAARDQARSEERRVGKECR